MLEVAGVDIWVTDLERALRFYREVVGLHFTAISPTEAVAYLGDAAIRLRIGARPCAKIGTMGVLPIFAVADMGTAQAELTAAEVPVVFTEAVPGAQFLTFLDPDGNSLQLVQYTDPREWQCVGS